MPSHNTVLPNVDHPRSRKTCRIRAEKLAPLHGARGVSLTWTLGIARSSWCNHSNSLSSQRWWLCSCISWLSPNRQQVTSSLPLVPLYSYGLRASSAGGYLVPGHSPGYWNSSFQVGYSHGCTGLSPQRSLATPCPSWSFHTGPPRRRASLRAGDTQHTSPSTGCTPQCQKCS